MDEVTADNDNNGMLVKTALGIVATVIVAALLWVGTTLNGLSVQVAVLQSNFSNTVNSLQSQITEAKSNTADRYTASQAAADARNLDSRIAQLVAQIADHEKRLRDQEVNVLQMQRRK